MKDMRKIMFVCLGNICRSPLAEAVFEHHLRQGDPAVAARVEVASSGTGSWHVGEPADERMQQTARARGVPLDHVAQQFQARHFQAYDLVLAMDQSNRANLRRLAGGDAQALAKIRLLREFEPDGPLEEDVPDPYYGGDRGFREVFEIVDRCCRTLYERIRDGEI